MGLKKHKEFRFAWQDAAGNLRAVVIQAEHHQDDDGVDRITINLTGDGVPLEARVFDQGRDKPVVKTRSRM